jgi:hypothetical protein
VNPNVLDLEVRRSRQKGGGKGPGGILRARQSRSKRYPKADAIQAFSDPKLPDFYPNKVDENGHVPPQKGASRRDHRARTRLCRLIFDRFTSTRKRRILHRAGGGRAIDRERLRMAPYLEGLKKALEERRKAIAERKRQASK